MSMGLSIPCYLNGQGGQGDNALADGASLFEEVYAESDAHFPIIGEPDILIVHPLQFAICPLQPLL